MENKINIVEILKDCPSGMELDCTMFENLEFERINKDDKLYPIICRVKTEWGSYNFYSFNIYGCYINKKHSKCVIFPKGKTTWEGFHRPFKDGDILATDLGSVFFLNMRLNTDEYYGCYVGIGGDSSFHICVPFAYKECCGLATEEEKEKLFQAIKDNGYKWNAETKTLEKLMTPNKFDITTLKPFDKVLVRDSDKDMWCASIFSHTWKDKYFCAGVWYNQCIPYEGNEKLLGTTNDCDEYYKTWE